MGYTSEIDVERSIRTVFRIPPCEHSHLPPHPPHSHQIQTRTSDISSRTPYLLEQHFARYRFGRHGAGSWERSGADEARIGRLCCWRVLRGPLAQRTMKRTANTQGTERPGDGGRGNGGGEGAVNVKGRANRAGLAPDSFLSNRVVRQATEERKVGALNRTLGRELWNYFRKSQNLRFSI